MTFELEGQPRAIGLLGRALREPVHRQSIGQALLGLAAQLGRFLVLGIRSMLPAPTVKRAGSACAFFGRNEQRSAISMVEASASGISANSTAISARVLKR